MSSYIHAGSDIITVKDVFTALHYMNGLEHSQMCVAETLKEDTAL